MSDSISSMFSIRNRNKWPDFNNHETYYFFTTECSTEDGWQLHLCANLRPLDRTYVTLISPEFITWPADSTCLGVQTQILKDGNQYQVDVEMYIDSMHDRPHHEYGYPGVAFNVRDEFNYDFFILAWVTSRSSTTKVLLKSSCFNRYSKDTEDLVVLQLGRVINGEFTGTVHLTHANVPNVGLRKWVPCEVIVKDTKEVVVTLNDIAFPKLDTYFSISVKQ